MDKPSSGLSLLSEQAVQIPTRVQITLCPPTETDPPVHSVNKAVRTTDMHQKTFFSIFMSLPVPTFFLGIFVLFHYANYRHN